MASGVCPPSPRKEDGRTADCNEYRKLPACTRRNPPMDLPEKENRTGGYPYDDFCPCGCGGTFAGAHAVGHQPVYGAAWRTYSGGDSGRADGTVQIYAGLFEAVEMCAAPLVPGELIRVVKGPLKGLEGELVEVDGKAKVVVRLDLLGCAGVDMPVGFVEKMK